jgi:hypothetical protein
MYLTLNQYRWDGYYDAKAQRLSFLTPAWRLPDGAHIGIDLRAPALRAIAGGKSKGYACFLSEVESKAGLLLSDDPAGALSGKQRDQIAQLLGVGIGSTTVLDMLWELFTVHADGKTLTAPLIPKPGLVVELCVGPVRKQVVSEKGGVGWDALQATLQEQYAQTKASNPVAAQKLLSKWLEEYPDPSIHFSDFIPAGLPIIEPEDHDTINVDDFNRANAPTLGTASGGWTWTTTGGNVAISGNQALFAHTGSASDRACRCGATVSSNNNYAKGVVSGRNGVLTGPLARYNSTYDSGYIWYWHTYLPGRIAYEVVSGVATELGRTGDPGGSYPNGMTFELDCSGTTITCRDGGAWGTFTATGVSAGVYGGWYMYTDVADDATLDDFEFGDLGGGGTTYTYTGSGGLTFAGTAQLAASCSVVGTGGVTFSGTALRRASWSISGVGGLTLSGSSPRIVTAAIVPSGGITFAGTSPRACTVQPSVGGGLAFSGTAPRTFTVVCQPSGGVSFVGSASVRITWAIAGRGGVVFGGSGGSAEFTYIGSGGLALAGSAPRSFTASMHPSGGLAFGGTAAKAITSAYRGGGGLSLSGTAARVASLCPAVSGGMHFAGTAETAFVPMISTPLEIFLAAARTRVFLADHRISIFLADRRTTTFLAGTR